MDGGSYGSYDVKYNIKRYEVIRDMTIQELIDQLDDIKKQLNCKSGANDEWLNGYTLNIVKDNITKIQNKINKDGVNR